VLIARSTCSCGLLCRATKHGEQVGLQWEVLEAKVRGPHRTTKVRALAQVNLIRPRYTDTAAANQPDVAKPAIGGEATSMSTRQAARGD